MMPAMSTPEITPLTEAEAREAVNRWSQGFFGVRYLGDKIFVEEIVPRAAYTLRLRTQYEERTVSQTSVPYHGGRVDDHGKPPGPWDLPVRRAEDFEERTETLTVPHTERVAMCPKCAGLGRVDCPQCNGTGQVNCPTCQGRGYLERQEPRQETNAAGQVVTQLVTVRNNCTTCLNGRVTCTSCSGNGRKTCPGCEGSGNVKTFDQLTVRFRAPAETEVVDATGVPDAMLRALKGDVLVDRRAPRIEGCEGTPAEVEERARQMLRKAQAVDERTARVLFQELHVERIPIHEVGYSYAGVSRKLWICGHERQVHAPGAPWRSGRLWALLGGIAAAIVLVILIVILLSR
jgi:hypothetical protein